MKRIAGLVYLLAGLGSVALCWISLMAAVWGAPTTWVQPAGLLASGLLALGGFGLLLGANAAQRLCAAGALGMAMFYVPTVIEVLPADSQRVATAAVGIELGYFAVLAAAFWFPRRLRWRKALVGAVAGAALAVAGFTTGHRWVNGEYDRPVAYAFVGTRAPAPLAIDPRAAGALEPALIHALEAAGCGGALHWTSTVGEVGRRSKLIVVAFAPIPVTKRLPYPKHGTVVYLWDGFTWRTFPRNAACYNAAATLHPNGMLEEVSASGSDASFGFLPDAFAFARVVGGPRPGPIGF